MADDLNLEAVAEWLIGREAVWELVKSWPPGTKVTSHEDAPLMIPAPGVVGTVVSWFENGTIGVAAPMFETLTSPITGYTARQGEMIKAQCEEGRLVLLEYGEMTPEMVDAACALAKALESSLH